MPGHRVVHISITEAAQIAGRELNSGHIYQPLQANKYITYPVAATACLRMSEQPAPI